ncbi:MAG: IS3-like element ISAfe17 family transposase [Acidithiobacillus sp.]|uniref:IS3-like element ISAfe17 family transposase n=1 Tax=Acidithiobacillus ferrooxidans TaxID=920 RepID=A0A2W1K3N7_ACIFR|nr:MULTISPECIES: IS3-like element ISAfe17 family transposase [Acidithiobacillus]MBU2818237.1 IS3-like element ISAfe17 family transposase [Acidithiobacillus ferrooxidans]MCR1343682.1 IS3-like element ISAfe17 family transposase [Acidithiobacillus ferrooxidans]PZD81259.1 IS3-like element ISAfe17 family transposase [Acidithiobacillus ferrooxidans]QLK42735.1 IS3-like element ISAfe17 family transposase [Acidithiobacillus ferrooxidans]QZT51834.1 IS3-like element ISAfe17 family transposase [Acidithiob
MSAAKRKVYGAAFKGKVGLEAIRGLKTINEIAQEHGVHPAQVGQWKKAILEQVGTLFEGKRGPQPIDAHSDPEHLYSEIGRLKVELDWLKKKFRSVTVETRRTWIAPNPSISIQRQCHLAGVARATVYAQRPEKPLDAEDKVLMDLLDAQYTTTPFYGSRRMTVYLQNLGFRVNRKRVQRLMRTLGLAGMAPGPHTSRPHPEHKIYPYLLRGLTIDRPGQVWSTDITYIRLRHGFVYLVAIMDWYSRKVLSWRISNTMEAEFCVACLEEALQRYGAPEIFNTDQGSQFTAEAFTGLLQAHGVQISMDGRGRALDNIFVERLWRSVKYEDIYLRGYGHVPELMVGLTAYFEFYNSRRPHQSLGYLTPDQVYLTGQGGGACIVDRYPKVAA